MSQGPFAVPMILSLALLIGCGGVSARSRGGQEDAARAAADKLPAADRVAFYEIATVDGLIRSRIVVATRSGRLRVFHGPVADARRRVSALAPRDQALAQARKQLLSALAALAARRRGAAGATLRSASIVYLGLARYQRQHPAVVGLVPD